MMEDVILNCIILEGKVYTLTNQLLKSDLSFTNNVCALCALRKLCQQQEGHLCSYFDATQEEYFVKHAYLKTQVVIDFYKV